MKSEYDIQADEFAKAADTKFKAKYNKHALYFSDDIEPRDIYRITLKTPKGSYTFSFGQSIANVGKEPSLYNVLSCLTKYDVGSLDNFCSEFGYDIDSRKAEKIYKAVLKEWKALNRIYTPEQIEVMREIQ